MTSAKVIPMDKNDNCEGGECFVVALFLLFFAAWVVEAILS